MRLPIKNVFVPGTGWASQVRTLLLLFTFQAFLSVKKSKMSAANFQSTPDSFQAIQSKKEVTEFYIHLSNICKI